MILETLKYLVENPEIAVYLVVVLAAQMELLRRDVKRNASSVREDVEILTDAIKGMRTDLEHIDERLTEVETKLRAKSPS